VREKVLIVCDVGGEMRVWCEKQHEVVILKKVGSSPIEG
jgi:hypothetical protein